MKKIFILTGEPSGDKLASTVVAKLKLNHSDIEYLSVGGFHLNSQGVKSIYDLKEITYIGFTSVILNILKIRKKINTTVKKIIEFNPDILLSVDSPDFTLRVAEKVKKNNPKIKTIHYVAPQVWVWREGRVKKFKKFLDHILLLFNFEKKYFDKENIKNTFVGHPLLENKENIKTDLSNLIKNDKKIISLFAGRVNKPNFSKLRLDFKGIYYIPRIIKASKLGDAAILKEIIKILAQNKIKTENSLKFNPELTLKRGNYSKIKPGKQDKLDIKKSIKTLDS